MPLHQNLRGRIDGIQSGPFHESRRRDRLQKILPFPRRELEPCSTIRGQVFLLPAGNVQSLVLVQNQTGAGVAKSAL
jgi:hypothetical protein